MKSILLLAYAISPTRGSEYSVGWEFVTNLAKNNKVYFLFGLSGNHMGDTEEVENYFKENPHPNIFPIAVKPNRLANFINWPNKVGIFGAIFYLAFPFWQKEAYYVAKKLIENEKIDVIHHLNPIGFREPGYLWKLDRPFVWGPIGAAMFVDVALLKNLPIKYQLFYRIKNQINHFQLQYGKRIRYAAEKSVELIFCNTASKNNFEKYLGKTGVVISEQGSLKKNFNDLSEQRENIGVLNMVWIGRVSYVKNIFLLFNVLALVNHKNKWKLNIIGGGECEEELKSLAIKLSISANIVWHGKKARADAIDLMRKSDLHVMTSLSEANTTVLYEATSLGIPTISIDRDGMHDTLANGNGILIPISTYEETIKRYANKIDQIIENPKLLAPIKERTGLMVEEFSWENKIKQIELIYEKAINDYGLNN